MEVKRFGVFLFVLCMSLISAYSFDDFNCNNTKSVVDGGYIGYEIPSAIPFTSDIFDVYIDNDFFISFELEDKKITEINCNVSKDANYKIYVSKDLISEVLSNGVGNDVVKFYNDKKASGDIKIEAVGFVKNVKLNFIEFGLWVMGLFG